MMVEIRVGHLGRKLVGACATYPDALNLAIRTLRHLENVPFPNPDQWVEIFDGDKLRMSAQVGVNQSQQRS